MTSFRTACVAVSALTAVALAGPGCGDSSTDSSTSSSTTTTGGGGNGGAGGSTPGMPLKVMDWNCHNFFNDKKDSPTISDEFIDKKYPAHLAEIAKVLTTLDPDIAVLQEVENENVLADVNNAVGGSYVVRKIIEGNDPRGINVAVMSKVPIANIVSHAADSFTVNGTQGPTYSYARDAVEYHITYNGRDLVLIGVHFKAKEPTDDPNKRLAEAQHTRSIADGLIAQNPNLGLVILGDHNDTPGSDPVNAVIGKPSNTFTDSASFVAAADQWSYLFNGTHELIDHQIDNPVMLGLLDQATVTILHNTDVTSASDHSPIMSTYLVK